MKYYNEDFKGEQIAFAGQFPIDNGSARNGFLKFFPDVDGVVRVTFSDTASGETPNEYRRYLAINGERTDYWTCRGKEGTPDSPEVIPTNMNVTSGFIPVKKGKEVIIRGLKEDGVSHAPLRISKVEFIKITDQGSSNKKDVIVGVTDDTFSQRIYSYDSNGKSVSKWIYGGYKNSTHGLLGGVEDNGIFYYSNNYYDENENTGSNDTNAGGNITFMTPKGSTTSHWLSCQYGSAIYVPVDQYTSGTIELTCTQDDYNNDGAGTDRYFELHRDTNGEFNNIPKKSKYDETVKPTFLALKKTSSATFKTSDLTLINGQYYLKLVSHFDEDYLGKTDANGNLYKGEMKVYNITVTMDGGDYTIAPPETDYDHEIVGEHSHAVFNWTQGTASTTGFHYGTLTMKNGAMLTGVDPAGAKTESRTETIHSYRDGDIVKYKTNYYGGLQLLCNPVTYTITPPPGYYITTSVRIHGHYNMNSEDTDDGLGHNTYVSSLGGGKWESYSANENDDTYIRFPRNDVNARTTTLDFTVPASESVDFQVSGYQIFGVIDAVLVPKTAVPALESQVFYKYNTKINVDITNYERLRYEGTLNYTPKEGEELWWYFEPDGSNIASRGRWEYSSNESLDDYPVTGDGKKDQNITKKFSVRNYKFVNATGKFDSKTDDLEKDVYDVENNYIPSSPSDITTMADSSSSDGSVSLTIAHPGTYYFYIHDKANNYNSPLGVVTFDTTTGVEDITIEDNYETDELDAPVYNIYGQRVDSSYRGIVIRNGRKYVQK